MAGVDFRKAMASGVFGAAVVVAVAVVAAGCGAADSGGEQAVVAGHGGLEPQAQRLEKHAEEMREHAEEMIRAGQVMNTRRWIDEGTGLMQQALELESTADMLRRADRDLSSFRPQEAVAIYRLRADGRAIVQAGEEMINHVDDMADAAEAMIGDAGSSAELRAAAETLLMEADALSADGRAVAAAGRPLIDQADELERSLGH